MGVEVTFVEQPPGTMGRQMVHDSESKAYPVAGVVDRSKWVTKYIRIFDPVINPNQCHGECTGCAKAMQMNSDGNRVEGVVFDMDDAHNFYHHATIFDPFEGVWPPSDTGSSGLASAKAAKKLGIGGEYRHVFNGADGVVQQIMEGKTVSVGTWWYDGMSHPNVHRVIEPTGPRVGGHQYLARAYVAPTDLVIIRCWWGRYRDVGIKRAHLNELILDGGDAHTQARIIK